MGPGVWHFPGTSPRSVTFDWDFTETCLSVYISKLGLTVQFGFPQSRAWDKDARASGSFGRWSRKPEGKAVRGDRREGNAHRGDLIKPCQASGALPYWGVLEESRGKSFSEGWKARHLSATSHPFLWSNFPALPGCTTHAMRPLPPPLTNQSCPSIHPCSQSGVGGWPRVLCCVALNSRMVINGMGAPRGRDQSRPQSFNKYTWNKHLLYGLNKTVF